MLRYELSRKTFDTTNIHPAKCILWEMPSSSPVIPSCCKKGSSGGLHLEIGYVYRDTRTQIIRLSRLERFSDCVYILPVWQSSSVPLINPLTKLSSCSSTILHSIRQEFRRTVRLALPPYNCAECTLNQALFQTRLATSVEIFHNARQSHHSQHAQSRSLLRSHRYCYTTPGPHCLAPLIPAPSRSGHLPRPHLSHPPAATRSPRSHLQQRCLLRCNSRGL